MSLILQYLNGGYSSERGGDTEVLVVPGDSGKLSGVKKHVINAQVADIFLVIANRKYGEKIVRDRHRSSYPG